MALAIAVSQPDQDTGAITVTASGSAGGSVSCYQQASDATSWTLFGTRTGNGVINATLTMGKTYYFYAVESTDVTAVTVFAVFRNSDAVMERCLAAVKAQVQSMATAGLFSGDGTAGFPDLAATQVVRQDELDVLTLESIFPCIVVVPGSNESIGSDEMTHTDDIVYPVQCIILNAHDATDQENKKRYLHWREHLSKKFRYQRLTGVTECRTVQITYNPIFEMMAQQYSQFRSAIQLSVVCRETRGV